MKIEEPPRDGNGWNAPGQTGLAPAAEHSVVFFFDRMLNETCGRLEDVKQRFSLKRIQALETALDTLERELNGILANPPDGAAT